MSAVPPEPPRASAEPTEPASDRTEAKVPPAPGGTDFGANEWLVDELYQRYLADPGSVDVAWWNFFADYQPPAAAPGSAESSGTATLTPPAPDGSAAATPAPGPATPSAAPATPSAAPATPSGSPNTPSAAPPTTPAAPPTAPE